MDGNANQPGFSVEPVSALRFDIPSRLLRAVLTKKREPFELMVLFFSLAVGGGFEPPVRLPVRQFSKLVVSATHPSHQTDSFFLTGLQIYKEFIVLQLFEDDFQHFNIFKMPLHDKSTYIRQQTTVLNSTKIPLRISSKRD